LHIRSSKLLKIEDRIFPELRLTSYGSGVVVIYIVVLTTLLFKGLWIIHADGNIAKIDFGYIWVTGHLAQSTDPARIFNTSKFASAQLALFGSNGWPLIPCFVYPPTFLLFTYPLGLMPYLTAFTMWMFTTFALYQLAIYTIISRPAAVILAATPSPVLFNLGLGQNGFLTAGLIGLSLANTERRPWLAGIFLGLLTYKPRILFPFALLAGRNWRVLLSAATASLVLGLTAAIAFGSEGWVSFAHSLLNRQSGLGEIPGWEPPLVSVFSLFHSVGASPSTSWILHLATAATVAITVCAIWTRPITHSVKAAALCIGSVLVTPYVLGYDLCVLSIAVAFLIKDALGQGFLPGEGIIMFFCWLALIFLVAPLIAITICVVLLALVARRAVGYRGQGVTASPPVAEASA
jgi:arabinofuranan 3-O-arabinosyltransferase